MAGINQLTSIWKNIKEFELAPIRKEAESDLNIALVGIAGSGRHTLAAQMRTDPHRKDVDIQSPLWILDLDSAARAENAHLIILMLDATRPDFTQEQALARRWGDAGKKVIVLCNKMDLASSGDLLSAWAPWNAGGLLSGSALQTKFLTDKFVPMVLRLLPDRHLALGRAFPLFRIPIARQLINETSYNNAAYAFGTGIAEVVPVLNVPLNITDMVVLTKAQAFLVYRLGLLLGFSTNWQDYVAEFGSVVGSGFLWRNLARYLVGLVPVWGIVPKVAVSYAGTFVVGNTILQWYLTGKHLTPEQVRDLYKHALAQGKQNAQKIAGKLPRFRLPVISLPKLRLPGRKKEAPALPPPPEEILLDAPTPQICPNCSQISAPDARFCQYCGKAFTNATNS